MTSKEILPANTEQENANWESLRTETTESAIPSSYYDTYAFLEESSEGMRMDETYLNPKGVN